MELFDVEVSYRQWQADYQRLLAAEGAGEAPPTAQASALMEHIDT